MYVEYGDYDSSNKVIDPLHMVNGEYYFLFNKGDKVGEGFFFVGMSDETKRGFGVSKIVFKDLKTTLTKLKTELKGNPEGLEKYDLVFHSYDENGEVDHEVRRGYNFNNDRWGKNPMNPTTFKESYLTPQGKRNRSKEKIGKFKDFLDL